MLHITNNTCPICLDENLNWNLNIEISDMELFKCGHGVCKECYQKMKNRKEEFRCSLCRDSGQTHTINFHKLSTWNTFSEWYEEWEIYIKTGNAKNVIKNSSFGKQLIRLKREAKCK